jgi:hypothetical protein
VLILCWHSGALGNTVSALIDCCTVEGGTHFPIFHKNKNLHHYKSNTNLYLIKHPVCDIEYEKSIGNIVLSSTSYSKFGKLLILLMAELKNEKKFVYDKTSSLEYFEQIEKISLTLCDKINSNDDWLLNATYSLDILDFWKNPDAIFNVLSSCNLTPNKNLITEFTKKVVYTNQVYYDNINKCFGIVDKIKSKVVEEINLTFFEVCICFSLTLDHYNIQSLRDIKLLKKYPKSTTDFIEIFN